MISDCNFITTLLSLPVFCEGAHPRATRDANVWRRIWSIGVKMETSEVCHVALPKKPKTEKEIPMNDYDNKPFCMYGSNCYRRSPSHLTQYKHLSKKNELVDPNLPPCRNGAFCQDRNLLHFAFYYHPTSDIDKNVKRAHQDFKKTSNDDTVSSSGAKDLTGGGYGFSTERNESSVVPRKELILSRGPSIVKSYSKLTEHQRKELLKRALEVKQELTRKLNDTEMSLKTKTEELEILRLKLDEHCLMVDGEKEAMLGTQIKYFPLFPKREYREESASEIHFRLAESQFYRLLPPGSACKVTKVEYVVQPQLKNRFKEARRKIASARGSDSSLPVLGFHGTKEKNIESICKTGFRVPGEKGFEHATDPGWYGKGVYFSEYPRYSMNYIKDSTKLLLCQVLPGRVYRCRYIIQGKSLREGFDSHMSPDGKEVVIFNSHHILPCYIVHYTVMQGDFQYERTK